MLAGPATDRERATIEVLSKRHADTPTTQRAELDRAYADAMREVARRFPTTSTPPRCSPTRS